MSVSEIQRKIFELQIPKQKKFKRLMKGNVVIKMAASMMIVRYSLL